jgi:hypothetical protein
VRGIPGRSGADRRSLRSGGSRTRRRARTLLALGLLSTAGCFYESRFPGEGVNRYPADWPRFEPCAPEGCCEVLGSFVNAGYTPEGRGPWVLDDLVLGYSDALSGRADLVRFVRDAGAGIVLRFFRGEELVREIALQRPGDFRCSERGLELRRAAPPLAPGTARMASDPRERVRLRKAVDGSLILEQEISGGSTGIGPIMLPVGRPERWWLRFKSLPGGP